MFHQIFFVLYLRIFQLLNNITTSLDSQKKKKGSAPHKTVSWARLIQEIFSFSYIDKVSWAGFWIIYLAILIDVSYFYRATSYILQVIWFRVETPTKNTADLVILSLQQSLVILTFSKALNPKL